jgi:hypothetical protein
MELHRDNQDGRDQRTPDPSILMDAESDERRKRPSGNAFYRHQWKASLGRLITMLGTSPHQHP